MKNITVSDIKKNNLSLIYKLVYSSGKISKQEIASSLNLSLPTVTEKIVKLEKQGLISKEGYFESSVGRRAVAYSICSMARISIGVGILDKQIRILSVDLKGNICASVRNDIGFSDSESYYKEVAYCIKDFILENDFHSEQILGVGFAIQGLTSVGGSKIIFGKTLGYSGLDISVFSQFLNYPCSFFHDAKCAANTELWFDENVSNALYLAIGNHLGGALITNGQIMMGENGHCGAVEHMQLVPNGRECYCGERGCIEAYSSISALLAEHENINDFFEAVRVGVPEFVSRWDDYLTTFAVVLNNLHLFLDQQIVIGGELSHYLIEEDLKKLVEMTKSKSIFIENHNYIHISKYPQDSVSVGAALYYIQSFLNQI